MTTNLNYEITYTNKAFQELYGYSNEEVFGCSPEIFNAEPDFKQMQEDIYKTISSGKIWQSEVLNRKKDGTIFICELVVFPLIDEHGKVFAYAGNQRDITERKKTENELKKFKFFSDKSNDAHFLLGRDAKFVYVNETACKIMGYSEDELLTLGVPDVDILYDMSKFHDLFDLIQKEAVPPIETVNKRKDGTTFPSELTVTGYQIDDKLYMHAALRDITDRKLANEALQKINDELETRVKKRTADLTSTIKHLKSEITERKRAEKKVNNYQRQLRNLILNLTTLEEKLNKNISEELHDNIGQCLVLSKIKLSQLKKTHSNVNEEINGILELIEQTIKFTRSLSFELANPILYQMGFIPAIKWLVERIQEKHDIKVDIVSNEKLNKINEGIRVILYKAINELLLNVVKHSKAKKVVVSLISTRNNIQIKVEDNGIGLNTSKIENYIIEKNSLGIFKIRENIKYYGGIFDIKSKPGQGTIVKLVIPIQKITEAGPR